MEKNNVKTQVALKITTAILFVLFIISVASFLYFQLYFSNEVSTPIYIRFLADTMRNNMGSIYYILIPAFIVLALLTWILIASYRENLITELENTIQDVDDDKMKKMPFQDVVCKNNDSFKDTAIMEGIVTQTLKSPIVSQKKVPCVHKLVDNQRSKTKVNTNQQFSPEYILQDDISSISELKKIIAKERLPEIAICSDGDLSKLSDDDRAQIQKINSINTNEIFSQIRQKNIQLNPNIEVKKPTQKHTYKILSRHSKMSKEKVQECKKAAPIPKLKYLTADEIIALYRKEVASEEATSSFVSSVYDNDNKTLNDMAKFYYESDIEEYKV